MKNYSKKENEKSILYSSKKLCPFGKFKKCIGEKCALYSITGYNEKGKSIDFGECSLFKLPMLIIDLKSSLHSVS